MTETVNIYAAKANLSRLIDRATAGEDVVIARAGKPMVRLMPVQDSETRGLGLLKGIVGPEPDGFFDPLTDKELADWT